MSSSDEAPSFFAEESANISSGSMETISSSSSSPSSISSSSSIPGGNRPMQIPYEVVKKWTIIYPAYIDASLKNSEGRRLALSKCEGCISPSVHDILEACHRLHLTACGVPKRYPRSDFRSHGRVHVQLKNETGQPLLETIPNKIRLLEEVAKLIPGLEGRQKRLEAAEKMKQRMDEVQKKGPRAGKLSKKEMKDQLKKQQQSNK